MQDVDNDDKILRRYGQGACGAAASDMKRITLYERRRRHVVMDKLMEPEFYPHVAIPEARLS